MNELRVIFDATADGKYLARLKGSWTDRRGDATEAADAAVPFELFLEERNFEDLRWYLEDFMDLPDGGAVVRARRVEGDLHAWGKKLHAALFAGERNAERLAELLERPEPRVLTIATADASLLRLPWELISDGAGPLTPRVSVRRQLEEPGVLEPRPVVLPLRILYVVSRPDDAGFIDPRLTTRSLLDALDPLGAGVRVDFCRPPTLPRMEALLRAAEQDGDPYDVVHFDGHGTFIPEIQLGGLCFEKANDAPGDAETDLVRADRLGSLLARYKIPLVVLEACRSATVGQTAVFRSVAPRLIQAGVSSVLSMGHAVHVEAARRLLERFYRELAVGSTIGQAVAQARAALIAGPERWIEYGPRARTVALEDWFLPHLYQRGLDEPLLPRSGADGGARPRRFDVFLSHNHADAERVASLARRLADKHGLRVWLDAWECRAGALKPQCEAGIESSRYVVVLGSRAALRSKWVEWELETARRHGARIIPVKLENIELPPELDALLWVDLHDPAEEEARARDIARLIRASDAEDARSRRGFRAPPASRDEVGSFPPPPMYSFQGRARELHRLERQLRSERGIVLHAMGGMGKTALATEAAHWWTRAGMFRDGACFVSFEQFTSADRAVQVLGAYLQGPGFEALPAAEQRRRAIELFDAKDVLFVWDNFESVLPNFQRDGAEYSPAAEMYSADERTRLYELFRELTACPTGHGRVLVTCRPGDSGLPGAQRLELRGLARADSLWLLSRVVAKDGLTLDDPRLCKEALDPLLEMLADHPLSIELVAPHLAKARPEQIVADFAKLLAEFKVGAGVERNESLRASLAFSTRRLSAAAQEALPWLGLFTGGVFEKILLDVSKLDPARWEPVRAELEATALIRVERELEMNDRPYLRFHPTLSYAAGGGHPGPGEARRRFVGVYLGVMQAVDEALHGANPRAGMEVMAREEPNFRAAARWAVEDEEHAVASALGETFGRYLACAGRLRERDAWVTWIAGAVRKGGLSRALANRECDAAWTLFSQGRADDALRLLESLLERLSATTELDSKFQVALTRAMLGRILYSSGLSGQAVPVLEAAVLEWEAIVAAAAAGDRASSGNVSMTLGDLANALRHQGRLDEALATSERSLTISRELHDERSIAAGNGRTAQILVAQGRFAEADARYDDAISAARRAGDKTLEGVSLQHRGSLADDRGQLDRAVSLYQQALKTFQEMGDDEGVMQTCNLLGITERKQGRLAEARRWYERSRELARERGAAASAAVAARNIGIVCQNEGVEARRQGREPEARLRFEEAKVLVTESLLVFERMNPPSAAASMSQLAELCLLLGELDDAEAHALRAREIRERLGLKEVVNVYGTLAQIARARGRSEQAAEWERKRDEKLEELQRRAAGSGGLPPQLLRALQALALDCARAVAENRELDPEAEAALAELDQLPAPLPDLATFLRRIAAGDLPEPPASSPAELQRFFEQLLAALREARGLTATSR